MGFDASGSMSQKQKDKSSCLCFHIVDGGLPTRPLLHMSVYDSASNPIGTVRPASASDIYPVLQLLREWKSSRPGTKPDAFINSAIPAMESAGRKHRQVVMLMFCDGEVSDTDEMRAAVDRLAKLGRLDVVWIAGIPAQGGSRRDIEDIFSPLGDKLIVTGDKLDGEVSFGVERLRLLLADHAGADPDKAAEVAKTVKAIKLALGRVYSDGTGS